MFVRLLMKVEDVSDDTHRKLVMNSLFLQVLALSHRKWICTFQGSAVETLDSDLFSSVLSWFNRFIICNVACIYMSMFFALFSYHNTTCITFADELINNIVILGRTWQR